jgi:Na+-transporting NADH:ubiquinone oxidoreductase subunit NqrF
MGSPYTTDLLYDDFFRDLAKKHSNFHYHTVISREQRPDGSRGEYAHQYIERRLDDTFRPLLASPRTLIYVCGLAGMQVGLFQMLAKQGLGRRLPERARRARRRRPGGVDHGADQATGAEHASVHA